MEPAGAGPAIIRKRRRGTDYRARATTVRFSSRET
jgi:hypothetical protein